MAEPTSSELRARYRELLNAASTKLKTDENADSETAEIMDICRILAKRGYVTNSDASDWIFDLSPNNWQGQDEN